MRVTAAASDPDGPAELRDAQRIKSFTDGVVAIALTLLVLPLTNDIPLAGKEGLTTADWVSGHREQLTSFMISFVVIAAFWFLHHGLFGHIGWVTPAITWLNVAWMFTIVWLPVPTAMSGSMDTDALQLVLYEGTMALGCAVLWAIAVVARRSPATWLDGPPSDGTYAAVVSLTILFTVALVLGTIPAVGQWGILVLFASGLVSRWVLPHVPPPASVNGA